MPRVGERVDLAAPVDPRYAERLKVWHAEEAPAQGAARGCRLRRRLQATYRHDARVARTRRLSSARFAADSIRCPSSSKSSKSNCRA